MFVGKEAMDQKLLHEGEGFRVGHGKSKPHIGGCQEYYGPFLGTLDNIRCRIIVGIQKRDHNMTTTHMYCFEDVPRSPFLHSM